MSEKEIGGILTPSMRQFYRETPDEKSSRARNIRQRTRNRFVAAIKDIDLLSETIRDKDRRGIVDKFDPEQLDAHLEKFIALFAREVDTDRFEEIVEKGIEIAIIAEGYPSADVSVMITVDRHPVELSEAIEKVAQGKQLSKKEATEIVLSSAEDYTKEEIAVLLDASNDTLQDVGERLAERKDTMESPE